MQQIGQRLSMLRTWLRTKGYGACVILDANPHLSEYIEPHYAARAWFSGFTGSNGILVVTETEARLWTDSRYYVQARQQLAGTGIVMVPQETSPSIASWLVSGIKKGVSPIVAVDASLMAEQEWCRWSQEVTMVDDASYWDLWTDRPELSFGKAFVHPLSLAGQSAADKIGQLVCDMRSRCSDNAITIVSRLDEVAWLLNLRGHDLQDSPLLRAWLIVASVDGKPECRLYADGEALDSNVKTYLNEIGVHQSNYGDLEKDLAQRYAGTTMLYAAADLNHHLVSVLQKSGCVLQSADLSVACRKAVKNEAELSGIREAMLKDGVMWVRFLMLLQQQVGQGWTEADVVDCLKRLKREQPDCWGESFGTIAAYGANGAIVHYGVTPETNCKIERRSLLLVDTGTQYLHGTTDMTRTLACGLLTETEKHDYTLVMKSHIALARAVFPEGTPASAVDGIARSPLWREAADFKHGTGHGVGAFLNVHEGPVRIAPSSGVRLQAGMVTSDEPGLYREGSHGVRIENLLEVVPYKTSEFGRFLQFKVLTLCPMDLRPLQVGMLDDTEKAWLNEYHARVRGCLEPYLTEKENNWLKQYAYEI
ncbi:MAG: aminopeptidase P family protein [Paludibacteraceae bacterium]|nr:aminopeptidase P family protein [Paludibacteraceae bacterium]